MQGQYHNADNYGFTFLNCFGRMWTRALGGVCVCVCVHVRERVWVRNWNIPLSLHLERGYIVNFRATSTTHSELLSSFVPIFCRVFITEHSHNLPFLLKSFGTPGWVHEGVAAFSLNYLASLRVKISLFHIAHLRRCEVCLICIHTDDMMCEKTCA